MILIKENTTKKLPGETSLFVTFEYHSQIVEALKALPSYTYDKNTKTWEVPLTSLAVLLDKLCVIDDITIELLPDKADTKDKVFELQEYKTKPFDYQLDGIQFGLNHNNFLLLDAPGLGKTLTLICLAQELRERENLEHCLVICGINTLKTNWKKEIEQHSNLSCKILGERISKNGKHTIGSVAQRLEDLKSPIDEFFVVTNIETLRSDDILKELTKGKANKFDMIVVDEIHTCFTGNTLISTEIGQIPIEYLVNNNTLYKVLSYNEITGETEYKKIKNKFKNDSIELLCLEFVLEDGSTIKIETTFNHPIYTKNRGYVCAGELTEEDEVVFETNTLNPQNVYHYKMNHTYKETAAHFDSTCGKIENLLSANKMKPVYFNKNGKYIKDLIQQISYEKFYHLYIDENKSMNEIANILDISESQCGQIREYYNILKPHDLIEIKKAKNNLLKYGVKNVSQIPEIREKARKSCDATINSKRLAGINVNNFRFGNGKISDAESVANDLLSQYGFLYNKAISVNDLRKKYPHLHYPINYKPDFYNEQLKLAIEIDGHNHNSDYQKELDSKKEQCLLCKGISTIRFTNEYVLNHFNEFKEDIKKLCKQGD